MRRILTTLLTSALIAALATPATLSAAADRDEAGPARTAEAPSVVAPPAPAVPMMSIRSSVGRAVSAVLAKDPVAQGRTPSTRRGKTAIRAQGGGGKTGMIIGLVSTLVGVAATVYMVREMQKAQKDIDENR